MKPGVGERVQRTQSGVDQIDGATDLQHGRDRIDWHLRRWLRRDAERVIRAVAGNAGHCGMNPFYGARRDLRVHRIR